MNKLKVLDFINKNIDWERKLSSPPYNLIIKQKYPFILLKYNQIESDMSNEIVQECRGLILKQINIALARNPLIPQYKVASMRFVKFFNYGQKEAARLSFPCEVSEKIDGSLIGVWYDNEYGWQVSTSGNIDAEDSPVIFGEYKSYRDIFDKAWDNKFFDEMNKNCTYIFELVSPYTRIIVPYKEISLYLLSIRNNITLEEEARDEIPFIAKKLFGDKIKTPQSFKCNSIEEVKSFVNNLTIESENFEGFVLCDNNFNRIKLKSPAYMELFFIKGEGIFSEKKIIKLILEGQDDDVLGYFPEYKEDFDKIRRGLSLLIAHFKDLLNKGEKYKSLNKKDFAIWAKEFQYNNLLFKAYGANYWEKDEENKAAFLKQYVENITISKLVDFVRGELENE